MRPPIQILLGSLLCLLWEIPTPAQTVQLDVALPNYGGTGGSFYGVLAQGLNESIYGTATFGGVHGVGYLFKVNRDTGFTVIVPFGVQTSDGAYPIGGLTRGTDGSFYGTTYGGGAYGTSNHPGGTVFKYVPGSGVLSTLYSFCADTNCPDGSAPLAPLIQGADGNFYGTTSAGGGASGAGTVFKITPSGTLTTLYRFGSQANDGQGPAAALYQGSDGNFYGATSYGGAHSGGTLFKITPAGALTTLYSFCAETNCTDGKSPSGLVRGTDGNFYGVTGVGGSSAGGIASGAGTVFKLTPAGAVSTLYTFCTQTGCPDGEHPDANLLLGTDGNLWGATAGTVDSSGNCVIDPADGGTIFKITPGGTLATIEHFSTSSPLGTCPSVTPLQATNGAFYGTTSFGAANGAGAYFHASQAAPALAALGTRVDYFGEAKSDISVWRPSTGYWYPLDGVNSTAGSVAAATPWGVSTDIPVVGDFDGDGKTDFAVFRPSNGTFYGILSDGETDASMQWGTKGDIPVIGDYNGDGSSDPAVFRPSNGTWYVYLNGDLGEIDQQWGIQGDIPVPADYDGDGKTDFAVWRPSNGTWYILLSSTDRHVTQQWGAQGDVPVPGYYNGYGKAEIAVWRPSNGMWFVSESNGGELTRQWGEKGDVPVARDFDGDGVTDFAVWRPSSGTWFITLSSTGQVIQKQWGAPTDIPLDQPIPQ